MTTKSEQVLSLLADGPLRCAALNERMKMTNVSTIVRELEKDGKVKTSKEKRNFQVALPDHDFVDDGGGEKKTPRKGKKKRGGGRRAPAKAAPRPRRQVEEPFIVSLTADSELVMVDGDRAPVILSASKTEKIATLILSHFKA